MENMLWDDVISLQPDVWLWGGDAIYADTDDMLKMKKDYETQYQQKGYTKLSEKVTILGTWDDHDYGKNDAGAEYAYKKESQQLFLDFLKVGQSDPRRTREGVYHSQEFKTPKGTVKVILLDTRYHRTALTRKDKKYVPNTFNEGTLLGKKQWEWLTQELTNSTADFTIIMSSIQVLSSQHRFEKWANFPHEVSRLFQLLKTSQAKNVIFLSGDRHISEFSKTTIKNVPYPVIDFTSSGLTHAYKGFTSEENKYRDGHVVFTESYGVLKFNFEQKKVTFQMRGNGNSILQEISQTYP